MESQGQDRVLHLREEGQADQIPAELPFSVHFPVFELEVVLAGNEGRLGPSWWRAQEVVAGRGGRRTTPHCESTPRAGPIEVFSSALHLPGRTIPIFPHREPFLDCFLICILFIFYPSQSLLFLDLKEPVGLMFYITFPPSGPLFHVPPTSSLEVLPLSFPLKFQRLDTWGH